MTKFINPGLIHAKDLFKTQNSAQREALMQDSNRGINVSAQTFWPRIPTV